VLKATKIGGTWIITRDDLDNFRAWWTANNRVVAGKENATRRPRIGSF